MFDLDVKQPMRRFSRGMLKQAAFWLAISMRPELLILDEPVDGLDPVMRRQVWALIMQDVAEYGTTVLISSHNLRELEDVCDRVGIIDRGRMLLERVLSELQENMTKLQLVLPEGTPVPSELDVLRSSRPVPAGYKTLTIAAGPTRSRPGSSGSPPYSWRPCR